MFRLAPTVRSAALAAAVACGLVPSAARGQGCLCGTPADEFRAAAAGLVREWIVQLPFDSAASRVEAVAVGDGLVVATSGDGGIHAVRAAASRPRLAFPGVDRHPDVVFILRVEELVRDEGGKPVPKPRLLRVDDPGAFTLAPRPDAAPRWEPSPVTAVTLLAMPKPLYDKLPDDKRRNLDRDSDDVLAVELDADAFTAGRHHLVNFDVSLDERGLAAVPRSERAGTLAWSTRVGAATGHAWPVTAGSRLVVVASELAAHAIDRETGAIVWEHPTGSLTAASAVQSGPWVYVPLATKRLLRLPVNPLGGPVVMEPQPGAAAPTPPESPEPLTIDAGGAVRSAPLPLDAGVLWVTDNGLAAFEWTPIGWIRHQLPESNPPTWVKRRAAELAGQPAVRGDEIYLASATGSLSRVDLNARNRPGLRTTWTTVLPDRPSAGPMVSGDVVVVPLGPSGMAAFSAADGRERWRSNLVGTLLAVMGGRAWLLDSVGRLTALDLASGSRRQSLCVGCFTLPVVAPGAERLVLASPGGLVVSLAPPAPPVTAAGRPRRVEPAAADPDARLP